MYRSSMYKSLKYLALIDIQRYLVYIDDFLTSRYGNSRRVINTKYISCRVAKRKILYLLFLQIYYIQSDSFNIKHS